MPFCGGWQRGEFQSKGAFGFDEANPVGKLNARISLPFVAAEDLRIPLADSAGQASGDAANIPAHTRSKKPVVER